MFKQFTYVFPLNNICILALNMDFLSYLTFFFLVFVSPSHIPMIRITITHFQGFWTLNPSGGKTGKAVASPPSPPPRRSGAAAAPSLPPPAYPAASITGDGRTRQTPNSIARRRLALLFPALTGTYRRGGAVLPDRIHFVTLACSGWLFCQISTLL